jgi:NOL1/NOP2/sun family putative RNA methylase
MIERYLDFLGLEDTIKLLDANETELKPTLRVNTLKITPDKLKKILEKKGFELRLIDEIPYAFEISNEIGNLGHLHEYLYGYYYLQNKASMYPPIILNPSPNEKVIDMCAAPGGKSTHLSQIMNNKGRLILIEKNLKRIPALQVNIRRMGVSNTIIINTDAKNILDFGLKVDKILLDAPCTGEGLIRQDSSRKKSKKLRDLNFMSKIQMNLLRAGLKSLKKGGELLYSTCSIAPEENELVIDTILNEMNNISVRVIPKEYGICGLTSLNGKNLDESLMHSQRIYPHLHDTIGFFLCLLEKK